MKTIEETTAFIEKAHEGQTDKAGKPYYLHPVSVMNRLPPEADHETKLAALLHDVIEDTDWTAEQLLAEGFSKETVEAVQLVSRDRRDGLSYIEWVQTIADSGNIRAIRVKFADNQDNSDPKRVKQLPPEMRGIVQRYQRSKKILRRALMNPTTKISKKMSFILRHKPESIGATLDKQGWLDTTVLLEALSIDQAQLDNVVDTCDKKRYEFNEDKTMIRASQGHSVKIDLGYEPAEPPARLFHGTVDKFIEAITEQGLQKMNRHHVHLSVDVETASKVGSRRGKPVILKVDAELMHKAGHKFYVSTNGVWLTEEVPPRYISLSHD